MTTLLQRAATALDSADYDVQDALDALASEELEDAEMRVLLRKGWNAYTQHARRLYKVDVRRGTGGGTMPLFVGLKRKGKRVQVAYPDLSWEEQRRWLQGRRKALADDAVAIAIGLADQELHERFPEALTPREAYRMAGISWEVRKTGTDG